MIEKAYFINGGLTITSINKKTFNSECERLGNRHTVKTIKKVFLPSEKNSAFVYCGELKKQYDLLRAYLNPYVLSTDFIIGSGEKRVMIVMYQPFIDNGLLLGEAIKTGKAEGYNLDPISDFFEKCLQLYNDTGLIPDIFGIPYLYSTYYTPNVLVTRKDGSMFPNLVDVMFSRISQAGYMGMIHSWLLSKGIKRDLIGIGHFV